MFFTLLKFVDIYKPIPLSKKSYKKKLNKDLELRKQFAYTYIYCTF